MTRATCTVRHHFHHRPFTLVGLTIDKLYAGCYRVKIAAGQVRRRDEVEQRTEIDTLCCSMLHMANVKRVNSRHWEVQVRDAQTGSLVAYGAGGYTMTDAIEDAAHELLDRMGMPAEHAVTWPAR